MENTITGYALSPQQQRFMELKRKGTVNEKKNIIGFLIKGEGIHKDLGMFIQSIVKKYSTLRTTIEDDSNYGIPLQSVRDELSYYYEYRGINISTEIDLTSIIKEEVILLNNLETDIGARGLKVSESETILLIATSPKVSDGDPAIFIKDIKDFLLGNEVKDEEIPFSSVSDWLNDLQTNEEYSDERFFWKNKKYKDFSIPLLLGNNTEVSEDVQEQLEVEIPKELIDMVNLKAAQQGRSANQFYLAAWSLLLHILTGKQDLVIGMHNNPRDDEELKTVVGPLAKFIPLYSNLNTKDTIKSYFQRVVEEMEGSVDHADYFNYEVFKESKESDHFSFGFEGLKQIGEDSLVSVIYQSENIEPFSLLLKLIKEGEVDKLAFVYNSLMYNPIQVGYIAKLYLQAIKYAVLNHEGVIDSTLLMSEELKEDFLSRLEGEKPERPITNLVEMLEEQSLKTPNQVAVSYKNHMLTYEEMDARSNQLAHFLQNGGVGKGDIVGVCMERSIDMVISMVGILKSGAAYVPMDPSLPIKRLMYIHNNSEVKAILVDKKTSKLFQQKSINKIAIEDIPDSLSTNKAAVMISDNDPAYVIYTSGSTGDPKGVQIPHKAICNHMDWINRTFSFNEQDTFLQKTAIGFDASVWEFYAPLTTGGTLVVAEEGKHADPDYLLETIITNNVTVLQVVPTMLKSLVERPIIRQTPLRLVFSGGEKLSLGVQQSFYSTCDAQLVNLYGPTEACINTTYSIINKNSLNETIGKPIQHTDIFILNNDMELVPPGVAGELYIGGESLALGYVNSALNEGRFVKSPFAESQRLYKTGDMVRYLVDGQIVYLGRKDRQVKIRGYRIEIDEIEMTLLRFETVRNVAVKQMNNDYLVAFIEPVNALSFDEKNVRQELSMILPEFMLPNSIVVLEEMPLLHNGKIDYASLDMNVKQQPNKPFSPPETIIEKLITPIWSSELKRSEISIDDNFFELGGHSLVATQVISKIRAEVGVNIPIRKLFESPTIRGLSLIIESMLLEENELRGGE